MPRQDRVTGPVLLLDDLRAERMYLAALVFAPEGVDLPPLSANGRDHAPTRIAASGGDVLYRYRFDLPADAPGGYAWNGASYPIAGDLTGDLRLAYVSCNGQEHGDMQRDPAHRNKMWARLGRHHAAAPFHLLLHGGDQIYADDLTQEHAATRDWPKSVPPLTDPDRIAVLRRDLFGSFFRRYRTLYGQPGIGWLLARVPSLMQWDDHDICDGWGSLGPEVTQSAVGQALFHAARDAFLACQQGCSATDLPPRFVDPTGGHLGWRVTAPGLRLVAPDLRSERTRHRILGPGGWAMMQAEADAPAPPRTLLMSSVPLLGPRLSVFEALVPWLPRLRKYEDDLRDQWQSRSHRASWQRMLAMVLSMSGDGAQVTALSGEIHLATHATMGPPGAVALRQLVASGITHPPPPRAWARTLGAVAALGAAPLPGQPITLHPPPGHADRYIAQRNFLMLTRKGQAWSARWDFEDSGPTPPLPI